MRYLISFIVLFPVILLSSQSAHSAANIWAVDDTEKIRPSDHGSNMQKDHQGTPLSQSQHNLVWQNGQVHIFGGKNEVVAFQLIVEAIGSSSTIQTLTLPQLCHNSGFCIKNTGNANDYYDFRGKNIEILSAHYIPVQNKGVDTDITRYPDPYYLDEVPEIMVPITAPSGKGGLPLTVPTNSNQALWFDIYIPKNAPPGDYSGNITIRVDGNNQTIPVKLKIYNFTLPDETHLKHFFRFAPGPIANRLNVDVGINKAPYRELLTKYFHTAYRHRTLLANNMVVDFMDTFYKGFYNGDYYNAANKYYGPGENAGHNMYPVGIFDLCSNPNCLASRGGNDGAGSGFSPSTEAQWRAASNEWVNYFNDADNGLTDIFYARHMVDEPNQPAQHSAWAYSQLRKYADWLHNNPGPGGNLKTLCTAFLDDRAIGYCDVWALNKEAYKVNLVNQARARGEFAGIYNGGNPMYGAGVHFIHTAAVDARVTPWVMERYGVDFYFQYGVVANYKNNCDFFNDNCSVGNSMYPSDDPVYSGEARGMDGPLVSVRLKYWRRGVQDFEYFWLAKQKGLDTQVNNIVNQVVPVAFDETPFTKDDHDNPWPDRGYQFEQRRRQLAELLDEDNGLNIPLSAGWNMVSSNREVGDPSLGTVLSGIEDDVVILKNGDGQIYWPEHGIDDIGDWDVKDGYLLFMNNPATFSFADDPVDPSSTPISLGQGWSMIAYLPGSPLPIDQALASLGSRVYLVKNGQGQVYWPDFNITEFDTMQVGQGYQVYLTSAGTLTYP